MPKRARCVAANAFVAVFAFFRSASFVSANPNLDTDFTSVTQWLSQQVGEGLAFNAGETFDPPHEVKDRRLQPDLSLGVGYLPLNKSIFPATPDLTSEGVNAAGALPSSILFPNLVVHLRAGLPGRCDFALRFADMTTPNNYKLSGQTSGQGQSNSVGADLRKHLFGEDGEPLLTFGLNYNYVFGRFNYGTQFNVNPTPDLDYTNNVSGNLRWNVASYGLNIVLSQVYGAWIPFVGAGYDYVTGSVYSSLSDTPNPGTFGFTPIYGSASSRVTPDEARALAGWQWNHSWINLFSEIEVKAAGQESGKTVIMQAGITLPFHLWAQSHKKDQDSSWDYSQPAKPQTGNIAPAPDKDTDFPKLIFME